MCAKIHARCLKSWCNLKFFSFFSDLSLDYRHGEQPGLYFHKVKLIRYHLFNVFVGARRLLHVILAADGMDDALGFKLRHLLLHVECSNGHLTRHQPAGTV